MIDFKEAKKMEGTAYRERNKNTESMGQKELNKMLSDPIMKPTKMGQEIIEDIGEQLVKMGKLPTDSNIVKFIKAFGM